MRGWELGCAIAGLVAGLAWWCARGSPQLASILLRIPDGVRRRAAGWQGDAALVCVALAVHVPALVHTWRRLGAGGSPIGPDSDENYLGAVSFLNDVPELYPTNRFPGYPWLMAVFAGSSDRLGAAGAEISMVAAVCAGLGAYLVGRQLVGRAAGLAGLVLCLRLPVLSDLGRQTTPYMLATTLDIFTIAAVVGMIRGRWWCAFPLAVTAGMALTLDPKQAPFVVAELALAGLVSVVFMLRANGRGRALHLIALVAALVALPVANHLGGACGRTVLSVEEIVSRAPVGMEVGEMTPGWGLGAPLSMLPATFLQISRQVKPSAGQGWFAQWARESLPMEFPDTSVGWLVLVAALPIALGIRRRWRAAGVVALLPLLGIAEPALHLYFQHRYFAPVAIALPVIVASGVGAVGGPAALLGVLASAVLNPDSPWALAGPGLYERWDPEAEAWSPAGPQQWAGLRASARELLPADAHIYDYASSGPWVFLAGEFGYSWCMKSSDSCAGAIAASTQPVVAVLFLNESPSHLLPQTQQLTGPTYPERLGRCWERRLRVPRNGAAYLWTCPGPPVIGFQPPISPPR